MFCTIAIVFNNHQRLERVYQFYTKYYIYYSYFSICSIVCAATTETIVYAVLCKKLIYFLRPLNIITRPPVWEALCYITAIPRCILTEASSTVTFVAKSANRPASNFGFCSAATSSPKTVFLFRSRVATSYSPSAWSLTLPTGTSPLCPPSSHFSDFFHFLLFLRYLKRCCEL